MNEVVYEGQSRIASLVESIVSVLVGFVITMAVQFFMLPLFGVQIFLHEVMVISVILVFVAFLKNYLVRRFFNTFAQRAQE